MLRGICVDTGQTAVLEQGKMYFLFPNGSNHYYVSNFPNQASHKGCFQSFYFNIIEKEEWPLEPEAKQLDLDPEKVYRARLIWRRPGYRETKLKHYFIKPGRKHGKFYLDSGMNKLCGCFPLHWFSEFEEVSINILDIIDQEVPDFDIKISENDSTKAESEQSVTQYVQLSLFDF